MTSFGKSSEPITIRGNLKKATDKAYCIELLLGVNKEQRWIPKSVCEQDDDEPTLWYVQEWWAVKENLL